MKPILETERLLLRELNSDDAGDFFNLNENPNVIKYTGDKAFQNIDEAREFLENYQDYRLNGYGRWAVMSKENNEFVGWCGLKYNSSTDETDVGFRFFEHYWNKGFATESAGACIDYGFKSLNLNAVVGRAMQDNTASVKVLEKLGMKYLIDFDFDGHKGVIYKIESRDF
ncbi:GNAT family N-acetyltransferase [Elizabethkingia anophelis]|uniref:Acetyltransferase n=1 Tax=Elizabethkingia anophelis TaxID=1117645 RepID=A0AAP5S439_9FLAO|nr:MULTISPECIES: GNAT family N-acetyltransferase [Elizabethkingia]AQW95807.1 acetyltransferase [Elizabethkingia anophelis]AQX03637.1 acetyltransferase [Elizabethkingia anophelis]KFC33545.1 acetyltransferase [Elizabethkingia anophelis]KGT09903.1 acetyltransferase [Elizabethkingia anophelis]KUF40080.1 acetyltransferase [Elizabethkingia anophelis]